MIAQVKGSTAEPETKGGLQPKSDKNEKDTKRPRELAHGQHKKTRLGREGSAKKSVDAEELDEARQSKHLTKETAWCRDN